MSRRKRYRKLRNEKIKNNIAHFESQRRAKREEREASDAKEQLGRARLTYEAFKTELCSESRTPPQVIAAFEAFNDVIRKIVKNKFAQRTILAELNYNEIRFLAAYGPKSEAQKAKWREEAKRLRTSNRRALPPAGPDGGGNVANN